MHKMASPTATGGVSICSPNKWTHVMPISAEITFLPMTAQCCAIGLEGNTKTSNALAPIDAIAHSLTPANPPDNGRPAS
jgi:hypothetical protein